jgi:hypothetical protein
MAPFSAEGAPKGRVRVRAVLALLSWTPLLVINQRLVRFKRGRGLPERRQERFTAWTWVWLAIVAPFFSLAIFMRVVNVLLQQPIQVNLPAPR